MLLGRRAVLAVVGVLALLVCVPASASADTYTVTRTDDPAPSGCLPGDCSLREALNASNASTTVDDVVVVPAVATSYEVNFESKPLEIEDEVEVLGAGADRVIIKGTDKAQVFNNGAPGVLLVGLTITGGAGGIQNNGEMTFRGVSIEHNERSDAGGGIQTNGPVTLESSFLGFNRGGATAGGGIQANAPVTIFNSTLAGNLSEGNGGINGNDTVQIISSAIVGNRSSGTFGAGVSGFSLSVKDSIFADNRNAAELLNCASFMGVKSLGGNVEDAATCAPIAGDRPKVDPRLGTLALHGGTTLLYDLLSGSPAIDFAAQCPPSDQRGVTRPQGTACDSGPFEFVPPPVVAPLPGDHKLSMNVGKGKLPLSKRNRVRVRLTCPSTEASPPCVGRVVLSVEVPPRSSNPTLMALNVRRVKFQKKFSIGAGQTTGVPVRVSRRAAEVLRHSRKARKAVVLTVFAEDAAHNTQRIQQRRSIAPR
jgi:hypothetical protein